MRVFLNGEADSSVVLIPLVTTDPSISLPVVKVGQEVTKGLLLCEQALLDFGMQAAVVDWTQVSRVYVAVPISVELQKSLVNERLPFRSRQPPKSIQEPIERYLPVSRQIEVVEEDLQFAGGQFNPLFLHNDHKLIPVHLILAVESRQRSENSAEVPQTLATLTTQEVPEESQQVRQRPIRHFYGLFDLREEESAGDSRVTREGAVNGKEALWLVLIRCRKSFPQRQPCFLRPVLAN